MTKKRIIAAWLILALYQTVQTHASDSRFTLTGYYDIELTVTDNRSNNLPQTVRTDHQLINVSVANSRDRRMPNMSTEMDKLLRELRGKVDGYEDDDFASKLEQASGLDRRYQPNSSENDYFRNLAEERRKEIEDLTEYTKELESKVTILIVASIASVVRTMAVYCLWESIRECVMGKRR